MRIRPCMLIVTCLLVFLTQNVEAALQCNGCHGTLIPVDNRPVDASFRNPSSGGFPGNHRTHMDNSADPDACNSCHPGSSSYNASHRDGLIKVSSRINSSSLTTTYNNNSSAFLQTATPTPGSCSSVNCHFETVTPIWGDDPSLTNCGTCHGAPPSGAHPAYLGGAAGSHAIHDQYYPGSNNCKKCHPDNATFAHATSAGNRDLKISFAAAPNNGSGSYSGPLNDYLPSQTNTFGVCNATYCHSNAAGGAPNIAPAWGAALPVDCTGCHGGAVGSASVIASGKHPAHVNNAALLGTNFGCAECHAKSVSGNTTIVTHANHVNGFADFSGIRAGKGSTYGTSTGVCSATYCHSDGKGAVKSMATDNWKGATTLGCKGCHGSDAAPAFNSSAAGEPNYANGGTNNLRATSHQRHTTAGLSSCDACHTTTTTSGTAIKTGSVTHTNGTLDVAFNTALAGASVAWTMGSKTCSNISCHGTGSASAQWGSTSCLGCHSVTQGNRVAVAAQFGGSNSHHIQGAITDDKCYQCHWEANSDGTINQAYHNSSVSGAAVDLVVYGSGVRPTSYTVGSTAVQYHYTTSINRSGLQKITIHCLGCHSDQNNAATPFGDGKTPKQYAWDGTSVAARYSQSGATSWGKYTSAAYPNAAKKKISKALSAHGNAGGNQRGWNTATGVDGTIDNTSGAVAVQCYDCHNSHGSAISGITSHYSSATGRSRGAILKDTVAGKGGYAMAYKPYTSGSTTSKDKRNPGANLCLDCHMTPTATTTPWGYTSTYGATQAVLGYWDAPMYKGYTTSGAEQRYPFKKEKNINGGHFGASMTMTSTPTATIGGLCTPCHDPHGVSPTLGAKQQYAVPLLKGTWLTSPYKEDTAPASNVAGIYRTEFGFEGVPYYIDQNTFGSNIPGGAVAGLAFNNISTSAGLCIGCHPKNSLTNGVSHTWMDKNRVHESVKGWKSTGGAIKHTYSCSKCHSAHTNSVLPRLMVTNCLDGRHKGQSADNPGAAITGYGDGDDTGCYGMAAKSPTCTTTSSYLFESGYGHIPGYYDAGDGDSNLMSCHEGNTGTGSDQSWNVVTPWIPAPTLISPTATAVSGTTATLGANLKSNGNSAISVRGTVWGTSAIPTGNAIAEGGTATGVFTHARTGLTAGTKIFYRGYATNSHGTGYSPDGSFYTEPSTQASGVNFTAVGPTSMTVNWTRGTGDGVIILMKQGSAVNSDPVYGTYTNYAASSTFGNGTQIGAGNYVVYKGTGTNAAITGLTLGTTYYVAVYEFKGTVDTSGINQGTNYKQTPATGSRATNAAAPTLISPAATAIGSTTATLGANLTSNGGAAITARGTVWGTSASPTGNAVAEGGTATGSFTHARTGLTAGTKIYYRGYATNSAGTGYSADGSFYTEPATQASAVSFTSVGSTGMTVNWTRGTGDGVIVLMKQGSAVNSDPVDGSYTGYTANSAFGSGTQIGTANYVIYKGTGTSAAITGLTLGATYYVAVYEYKGTVNNSGVNQGVNYKPTPATSSQATSAPTVPALTSPTATAIGSTTATLGANLTSNGGAAITARGTAWGTSASPTGNAVAEGGTATGVFTHARTGLTAGTKIYYRGYATNSVGTGYSVDGSFYTEPGNQASGVNFTAISSTDMTVNWTRSNGAGVIVLIKQGSAVTSDPVDGTYTGYTASSTFGSGTQVGTGNYVIYKGAGTSVAVTGLTAGTTYYVAVYEYQGAVDTSGADQGTNYKSTPATANRITTGETPPAAPTLLWPPDGYQGQVGFPTDENPLQWSASAGAIDYYYEYWGADSGSGWTTDTSFNPGDLTDNYDYYWRVKARNASGESGWSATWSWYDLWE